jgi:hypothetical protein
MISEKILACPAKQILHGMFHTDSKPINDSGKCGDVLFVHLKVYLLEGLQHQLKVWIAISLAELKHCFTE